MLQLSIATWKHWQRPISSLHDIINQFRKNIQQGNYTSISLAIFFAENPLWYQQFDLRVFRILRGGQPCVYHDTTDNCRLYVAMMKAMNFRDYIPSFPIDNFKDLYVLVFDLTSMQNATEYCHYPDLVGQPLRVELYFSSLLVNVTEVNVLGEQLSSIAVKEFGVVGKNLWNG